MIAYATGRRPALVATVLAAWLLACMTPAQHRRDELLRLVREWNNDVRWARYETAAERMPAEDGRLFLKRADLVEEELVLADHEVQSVRFGNPDTTATVLVMVQWYEKRDPILRRSILSQTWENRDGVWLVTAQRRVRGERFPLVPEPATPAAEDGPKDDAREGDDAPAPATF